MLVKDVVLVSNELPAYQFGGWEWMKLNKGRSTCFQFGCDIEFL